MSKPLFTALLLATAFPIAALAAGEHGHIALLQGRAYVVPDDIRAMRHPALRHRLVLTYDALANDVAPESLVDAVFAAVPVP